MGEHHEVRIRSTTARVPVPGARVPARSTWPGPPVRIRPAAMALAARTTTSPRRPRSPRQCPRGDPDPARRTADARLRDDPGDRAAQPRLMATQPGLGLPDPPTP